MLGSVAFSPDSRQLATGGNDAIVKVWDVTDLETNVGPEYFPLGRHPQGVRSLAFSPDNNSLASAGADGTVKIWDATTSRPPNLLLALGFPPLLPAALVNAWVATTGPEIRGLKGHRGVVAGAVFSPDGQRLASAGEDGTVIVRDGTTGGEIFTLASPPARSAASYSALTASAWPRPAGTTRSLSGMRRAAGRSVPSTGTGTLSIAWRSGRPVAG
jgi:hypothetical protein